ncbi:MAG: hypothetical protein RLY85_986 [Bacteroidota bacterium]|jgi:uncharacterized YigZ family protein
MMNQQDPNYFQTIEQPAVAEFSDRGSKFIAFAQPVLTVDDFKLALNEIKKAHPKASHHCFAYRLGPDGLAYRVTDAGEPSGTAGRPILGQIDSKGLTNVLVVVVRYFGGTLLGVPGLINAYKSAAALALQLTPIVRKPVEIVYDIQFDYTVTNDVMKVLRKFSCQIMHQEMQLFCQYDIGVPKIHEPECIRMLAEVRGITVKKKSGSDS